MYYVELHWIPCYVVGINWGHVMGIDESHIYYNHISIII